MKKFGLLGSSALCSAVLLAVSAVASPAMAQEIADDAQDAALADATGADSDDGTIVITGSRIRRPNIESAVPVTSIGGEEFFETGRTAIGDVLNELPSLRTTIGQSNSTRFLGTSGLNLLDLRGLGTQRTLVLQNGRRHVGADILSNGVSVDTNQIPTDLIERVDVVTGGSSAIYGSDAIAGVVNFVLKRDYEGFQIRGQAGISEHGDAGQYYMSGVWGTNFADGRGNIAVNVEYAKQQDWYAAGRKSYRNTNTFVQVDSDEPGLTNGSDGNPDSVFLRDVRSGLYSNGGTFLACCNAEGTYLQPYLFQQDGSLIEQTGEFVGLQSYPSVLGGNGNNFNDGRQTGFTPDLDRLSVNLIGHFEISPAFEPFIEAKYVRTNSLGNASGPFFFSGGTTGSPREVFNTANPYLNPQTRQFLLDYYGTTEDSPFYFQRNVVELGNREEKAKRETYRIVVGTRGTFNDDWNYELSANYGEFKEGTRILGNLNVQRFLLAIDAVDQGLATGGAANGNIVCRAKVDPSAAIPYELARLPDYAQAQLANDVASCVPVNVFGEGNITEAARNYLVQDTVARGKITQFVASGFLSGDLSSLFELPGGPIGFAIGAEYRRETNHYQQDPLVDAGLTFYNAIPTFAPPAFEVKEAYGEIRIPLLADRPFFHELTVNAAGRVADYKGAGTVYAYNAGLEWAPIPDLRFRGQYARSVRAPNLTELYTPAGQNFAPGFSDPCDVNNIGDSPNRAANCAADGIPANTVINYEQSLGYLSGGNADLSPEKSDSYTLGLVAQPRIFPGFSLSVDYYDITVNNVIVPLDAQTIVDACYDEESLDNPFCGLFQRNGAGTGPNQEDPYQILTNSLLSGPVNFAKLKVRGIDVEAAYRHEIDNIGTFSTRLTYTHVLQNDNFLNPLNPDRADRIKYELGDPVDAFNWNFELKRGQLTLGYELRYLGKMTPGAIENIQSVQGRDPENEDAFDIRFYPEVFYHDIRVGYDVNEKFNFYFGVDNVTDRLPPFSLTGIGAGSGIYNNIGRFFYAGAIAKF